MKKRIMLFLLALCMCLLPMLGTVACDDAAGDTPHDTSVSDGNGGNGDEGEMSQSRPTFEPTFASATYTYDGTEKNLTVTGVPESVTVFYEGNGKTEVGVYEVTAVFYDSTEAYKVPAPMKATLTIQKVSIAGISFTDQTFSYDGYTHFLFVQGELPSGVTVNYTGNGKAAVGEYTVTATFSDSTGNYTLPEPMTATMTIKRDSSGSADLYGRETDDLPDDLNYKSDIIRVLHWSDHSKTEYDVDQITSDDVNNAIYERNREIERRLNMEFIFTGEQGNYSNASSFARLVEYTYEAKLYAYDLISAHSLTMTMLAMRGYLEDLNAIETSYLDFDKPWWPKNLQSELALGDALYTVTGDMSTNTLWNMEAVFFNSTRLRFYWNAYAEQQGHTDAVAMLYDRAKSGKWTLDQMINLTRGADGKGLYTDSSYIVGEKDEHDRFGFATVDFYMTSFYAASGLRLVDGITGDRGELLASFDDLGSESTAALVTKLSDWLQENSCFVDSRENGGGLENFEEGRAMLTVCSLEKYDHMTEKAFSGGILPMPKLSEAQTSYHTGLDGGDLSLYGIYSGLSLRGDKAATLTQMTAVLECWAAESYRLITPEIYEAIMQLKYGDDAAVTAMFELVRGSLTLDYGMALYHGLGTRDAFNNAVVSDSDWEEAYGAAALQEKWAELYLYTLMEYARE